MNEETKAILNDDAAMADIHEAELRLKMQPETALRIDEFLANPDIGVRFTRPKQRLVAE